MNTVHQRWFNEYNEMMPRGGFTIIIVSKDGIDTEATAKCNPKENYRKKLGVQICLGRINEQLNGTR